MMKRMSTQTTIEEINFPYSEFKASYNYSGILQQTRPGTEELAPVAYFPGNLDKTQVNKLSGTSQRRKLTLSTNLSRDLHFT